MAQQGLHRVFRAWLFSLATGVASVFGQTSPPPLPVENWTPLPTRAVGEGIDLVYQVELLKAGWQIQIRNNGTRPVHFGFYLSMIQSAEDVVRNGRMHIRPGDTAAPFIPWVGEIPATPPAIVIGNFRVGDDDGLFLFE